MVSMKYPAVSKFNPLTCGDCELARFSGRPARFYRPGRAPGPVLRWAYGSPIGVPGSGTGRSSFSAVVAAVSLVVSSRT